jgi:hypothetical protein
MDTQLDALESMPVPQTKTELMERIVTARAALDRLVGSLSDAQLAARGPNGGWAVKDHLTHIATWEQMSAAHLRGGSDHEVVGMDEATYEKQELDSLNAAIYEMHSNREPNDVRTMSRDAHAAVLERLADVDETTLQQAYSRTDPEQRTVMQELTSNTYDHYIQHLRWMEEQVAAML